MPETTIIHATAIEIAGKGVLIIGPSGAGKSSLALQLMGFGAKLIADDQTRIAKENGVLIADAPDVIRGRIEARGVGLLRVPDAGQTPLALVVDLNLVEQDRLPKPHQHSILGTALPCLHHAPSPHFAIAVWFSVKGTLDRSS